MNTQPVGQPVASDPRALLVALEKNLCAFSRGYDSVADATIEPSFCKIWIRTGPESTDKILLVRHQGPVDIPDDMIYAESWVGMVKDLTQLDPPHLVENLTIIRARSPQNMKIWGQIAGGDRFGDRQAEMSSAAKSVHFLAALNNRAVATSALVIDSGVAGLYCMRTLPKHRGQGFGKSVTAAALWDARDRGAMTGVVLSTRSAQPFYQKLGFAKLCEYDVYKPIDSGNQT